MTMIWVVFSKEVMCFHVVLMPYFFLTVSGLQEIDQIIQRVPIYPTTPNTQCPLLFTFCISAEHLLQLTNQY